MRDTTLFLLPLAALALLLVLALFSHTAESHYIGQRDPQPIAADPWREIQQAARAMGNAYEPPSPMPSRK